MENKIMLIDGNSIINRAFYALPILTNKEGQFTNAVYGFLNIILKLYDTEAPSYIAVAFDLKAKTFRHDQFEGYKGTRKSMPDELRQQLPILKNLLEKMEIKIFQLEGYEADDILGTLAKASEQMGMTPVVVSGDRDLLQVATDKTKIVIPKTKGGKTETEVYFKNDVVEKIGVTPTEYIDVKALMGDTSDNIPGVPGIGEKTAVKIIQQFGNIENAIENAASITPKKASENIVSHKDDAIMSKALATICTNVPIDFVPEETKACNMFNDNSLAEIRRLDFKTLVPRFKPNEQVQEQEQLTLSFVQDEYKLIQAKEAANQFVDKLFDNSLVAFTFVYNGTSAQIKTKAPIGISFCTEKTSATFVEASESFSINQIVSVFKPFFESDIKKICLDSKHEVYFLKKNGIDVKNIVFDAMLAAYILNSSKQSYNYDDIALDFLNEVYPSEAELIGKGKSKAALSGEQLLTFACRQAQVAFRCYEPMNTLLAQNNQTSLYYDIEFPLAFVLADMELFGIKVDTEGLVAYGNELDVHLKQLTQDIYNLSGEEFNINSPAQLGVILFEKLGLKGTKKTKTGYSTAADVLEKLKGSHEVIEKILEYRSYAKLKSTYADGLLAVIDKETEKIYSTFNQTIASTGRISSTEPNLQNIPIKLPLGRQLRKVFVPESSFVFVDVDYSQIELRVLAHMADDETLINAFNEGQDIHRLTASQVFKVPFDKVTSLQRSNAKAVNFGIVYGIGAFSLSQDLGITKKEADRYISGYFEKYPNVKTYLDKTIEQAKKDGFATTIFNRRRAIPELASTNFNERAFGERVAMNMPVQGTAADIIKIAMIRVSKAFAEQKLRSRLILQVHDELLVEAAADELETVKTILKNEMENAANLKVVLETDIHEGATWYDAK